MVDKSVEDMGKIRNKSPLVSWDKANSNEIEVEVKAIGQVSKRINC